MTVFSALLEFRKCQDGKCKSGKIIGEGKFWKIVYSMTLKLKSKELILKIIANSY